MRRATREKLFAVLAPLLAAGLLVAGCGGSGSSDPLTRSEFIEEANTICQEAEAERSEVLRGVEGSPALSTLASEAISSVEGMTEELAELNPPAADSKEIAAIVGAFQAGVAEVKADSADPSVGISAFAEASSLAEDYGLTDCTI